MVFVPRPLALLDQTLPAAFDLVWKVGGERHEAAANLNLCPLSRWQGSLSGFRSSYDVRRWIRMTGQCVLPNMHEGTVLCFVMFFQAGNMGQEISLKCLIPFVLLAKALST